VINFMSHSLLQRLSSSCSPWRLLLALAPALLLSAAAQAQDSGGADKPMSIIPTSPVHDAPVHKHAPAASPASHAATAQLPNGASSVTETYGDWTMTCRVEDGGKLCNLSQAQGNKDTGQRSFAIEMRAPKDGKSSGVILMPFGLKLETGAILKLDDKDLGQGLRFSTCVPEGCLLPISFPTVATDAMKTSKTLAVASLNLSSGQAVVFNVSLKGFGAALDRAAQLGR
jgi:invasion protein IalB